MNPTTSVINNATKNPVTSSSKPSLIAATKPAPENVTVGSIDGKYGPVTYGINPSPTGAPVANKVAVPKAGVTLAPPAELIDDKVIRDRSGFSADYVDKVLRHLKNDNLNITTKQVRKVLKNCPFSDNKEEVLEHVGPYIVNLTADNLVSDILSTCAFSEDKLTAVHCLVKYLRKKLKENDKDTIISHFPFSSDQEDLREWFEETS